jgi:hypothetical protein
LEGQEAPAGAVEAAFVAEEEGDIGLRKNEAIVEDEVAMRFG